MKTFFRTTFSLVRKANFGVIIGFLGLVIASGILSYSINNSSKKFLESTDWVSHTYKVINQINVLLPHTLGNTTERERLDTFNEKLKDLKVLTKDNGIQQLRIARIESSKSWEEKLTLLQAIQDEEVYLLEKRQQDFNTLIDNSRQISLMVSSLIIGLLLGLITLYLIDLKHRLDIEDRDKMYQIQVETQLNPVVTARWDAKKKDAVIINDPSGWNRAAETLIGYKRHEIAGKPVSTILPEHMREAHNLGLIRMMSGGEDALVGKKTTPRDLAGLGVLTRNGQIVPIALSLTRYNVGNETYFSAILEVWT